MEINLSDTPQVLYRDGHRCYSNNGSVIYGFHVHLREIYSNSEKDFDAIHDIWYNARGSAAGSIVASSAAADGATLRKTCGSTERIILAEPPGPARPAARPVPGARSSACH